MIFAKKKKSSQDTLFNTTIHPNSYIKLALDVYKEIDELDSTVACKKACCLCCNDYFLVSEREYYAILLFLFENFTVKTLSIFVNKAKEQKENLRCLYPDEYKHISTLAGCNTAIKDLDYNTSNIHLDCSCPFLIHGLCAIYPVRPTTCRLYGCFKETDCPIIKKRKNDNLPINIQHRIGMLTMYKNHFRRPYPLCFWFDNETEMLFNMVSRLDSSCVVDEKITL